MLETKIECLNEFLISFFHVIELETEIEVEDIDLNFGTIISGKGLFWNSFHGILAEFWND